jgi:hypothetical protein
MNIFRYYKKCIFLSFLIFIVFIFIPLHIQKTVINNLFSSLVYLVMTWSIYYFSFVRLIKDLQLDEREKLIFTKTGHAASFVFISVLLFIYYAQDFFVPLTGKVLKDIWGWFLLPAYILVHSLTGLFLIFLEESRN